MNTKDIVYISLFAAIMASFGLIPKIDFGGGFVPFSIQSIIPIIAGAVLGAKRGFFAILLFIGLVAIGLPVLTGGRGGLGNLFGATGGFIFGWLVVAYLVGFFTELFFNKLNVLKSFIINSVASIIILYLIGIPWLAVIADISLSKATIGMLPFIPIDIVKALVASFIILAVKKNYPIIDSKQKNAKRN